MVSSFSQIARSLVSALEHVGKHHCGAGSCRACGGSAGIAAGFTGCEAIGKVVGCPAQADNSSASGGSISSCLINELLAILDRLIDGLLIGLFFRALDGFVYCLCLSVSGVSGIPLGLPFSICDRHAVVVGAE
ncbi:hypothetical protein EMIT0P253_10461 [Pseudomonas sp. IT-P253]